MVPDALRLYPPDEPPLVIVVDAVDVPTMFSVVS